MKRLFSLLIFFSFPAFSQTITEVRLDIKTNEGDKKTAIKKAVDQISKELVENFLGQEKYQKNKKKINQTIIKNQNRYILFSKTSSSIPQNDGKFLTTVTLGISEKNLEGLLLEHNLFYSSQGSLCVLPVIAFSASLNEQESYLWWFHKKQNSLLEKLAKDFYNDLSLHLIDKGFYSVDPLFSRLYEGLPPLVLRKKEKIKNIKPLADFLQCHIILTGKVSLKQNKENEALTTYFVFKIFNTLTNQVLFKMRKKLLVSEKLSYLKTKQLERVFSEVSQRILISIADQLSRYKEKGVLDLNRLFLAVYGPLTYPERETLEEAFIHHIPSIKTLQKRYITSNKIVYEIKSDQEISQLANIIRKTSIPNYKIKVTVDSKKKQLEIYARTQIDRTTPKSNSM